MKVSDVMSTDIVTVTPDTPLKDAATTMLEAGVSGLPVVDDGFLVGIITEADFVDREAANDPPMRYRLLGVLFGRRTGRTNSGRTVGDVMSTDLVTVEGNMSVARAARFMVDHGVKRLPVVDESGRLAGVISRADVMTVFVRPDDAIAGEVSDLLSKGVLPIAPGDVNVTVDAGIITLAGSVNARVDAQVLEDIASHMDGVLGVVNQLEWEVDNRIPEERFAGYPREGKDA